MKKNCQIFSVILLISACNTRDNSKTFSKAILKNKSGVEYCVILPNTYQKQNVSISEVEIEKTDKFVVKAFDSLIHDLESEIGQKSKLKLDAYKRQYIPSINKENHRTIYINGLMEPIEIDWKNTIYAGGGGGQKYYTGEFDLETGKGVLAFNAAL